MKTGPLLPAPASAILAVLCLLLLGALAAPGSIQAAPQPVQASQAPLLQEQSLQETVMVTGTLGVSSNVCATNQTLYLPASNMSGSVVYPCYTLENTGVNTVSVSINVNRGGPDLPNLVIEAFNVAPGARISRFTFDGGNPAPVTTARSFTADVFVQELIDGEPQGQSTSFTVVNDIVAASPQINVSKTVGNDPDACSTQTSATVPNNGTAYFCIRLENRGDVVLTQHTLNDTQLGNNLNFDYTLAPQATLVITNSVLSQLGLGGSLIASNLSSGVEHRATVTSRAPGGVAQDQDTGTATVSVSRATVTMAKTVNFDPASCSNDTNATSDEVTPFYYCVRITNTGEAPLTTHSLYEFRINIDTTFNYVLEPGEVMELTNVSMEQVYGGEPTLGPFFIYQGPNNIVNFTMLYTGTNEVGNVVTASAGAVIGPHPTPTPTPTSPPRSMPTLTPFPTDTPTLTPIPDTPTPTETPIPNTPTPTWTPTPDLRVTEVQTPRPGQDQAGVPAPQSPLAQAGNAVTPQSPLEPDSPLAAPTQTPTESPSPTPTETPTISPTPSLTWTPTWTATPQAVTPTPTPTPTSTPEPVGDEPEGIAFIVVTNTPAPDDPATLQAQRPIVPPTPTPTPDALMFFARTLDTAASALAWIWFLAGSLVFFATAGIVAGLFFRQNERRRFHLMSAPDEADDEYEWDDE